MDAADTVVEDGVVYIDSGVVAAVRPAQAPAPEGFAAVTPTAVGGTIYPGLIELHNHPPYNILQLWQVPKPFTRREQWRADPEYHRLVKAPMQALKGDQQLLPSIARYVEVKSLVNGTTTSQGITLEKGLERRTYRGLIRNVEQTGDPALPEAISQVCDVEATNFESFCELLGQGQRLLLHLAEGTDPQARDHFLALKDESDQWAITDNLVGIHCTALTADDFRIMADHGASMVWSPLSNLLLYGQTADIAAARQAGLLIGLGPDWSPSGSKGLLGELKAARLASSPTVFTDRDLVAMATRDAAVILRWEKKLGSLQTGHYADLLVVAGTSGDPYTRLISAQDDHITLVVIGGTPRYGTSHLMRSLLPIRQLEAAGATAPADRLLNLIDPTADPLTVGLSLSDATDRLATALADLPNRSLTTAAASQARTTDEDHWHLALDEIEPTGMHQRPLLSLRGTTQPPTEPIAPPAHPAQSDGLPSLTLDELTATRDNGFLHTLLTERNLPPAYGSTLAELLS